MVRRRIGYKNDARSPGQKGRYSAAHRGRIAANTSKPGWPELIIRGCLAVDRFPQTAGLRRCLQFFAEITKPLESLDWVVLLRRLSVWCCDTCAKSVL